MGIMDYEEDIYEGEYDDFDRVEVMQEMAETCDWCREETNTVYPVYCTEADPTTVDYWMCAKCHDYIHYNPAYNEEEEEAPF